MLNQDKNSDNNIDNNLENLIKNKLSILQPTTLELQDESHLHIGHAGVAERGGRHYSLTISAEKLINLSKIKQHQLIYNALGSLVGSEIHALKIKII